MYKQTRKEVYHEQIQNIDMALLLSFAMSKRASFSAYLSYYEDKNFS